MLIHHQIHLFVVCWSKKRQQVIGAHLQGMEMGFSHSAHHDLANRSRHSAFH